MERPQAPLQTLDAASCIATANGELPIQTFTHSDVGPQRMGFRIGDFKRQIDASLLDRKGKHMRSDGRAHDQLRPVKVTPRFSKHAEGSALIEVGDTKVLCTVSVEERVPRS